jgi:pyruvate formate lyase activating enzyme
MMLIKGFLGTSLIDYPGKISAIVFTGGCNFRCPFCHNSDLVLALDTLPTIIEGEFFKKIEKRRGFIDGIVITGGEPLINRDILNFIKKIKDMGFLVKLDTNGSFPELLNEILNTNTVDFIAMDIKSSPEKYSMAAGVKVDISKIEKSISLIMGKSPDYEFRTTMVPGITEEEDMIPMVKMIEGAKSYAIQQFRPMKVIDPRYLTIKPFSHETLLKFVEIVKPFVGQVELREE